MLPRDAAPFSKILKENGYATAGIGKWHLTPGKEQGPGWPVQPLAQRLGLRLLLGLPGPRGRAVRHHDLGEPRSPRRHGSRAAGTMMRRAAGEHYLHRPPPRAAVRGVPDAAAVPRGTGDDPGRAPTTTGNHRDPSDVTEREYGLVVVGSPTWWLSTNVSIRSFLESETAARVLAVATPTLAPQHERAGQGAIKIVTSLSATPASAGTPTAMPTSPTPPPPDAPERRRTARDETQHIADLMAH
jgi:hypothetical protein